MDQQLKNECYTVAFHKHFHIYTIRCRQTHSVSMLLSQEHVRQYREATSLLFIWPVPHFKKFPSFQSLSLLLYLLAPPTPKLYVRFFERDCSSTQPMINHFPWPLCKQSGAGTKGLLSSVDMLWLIAKQGNITRNCHSEHNARGCAWVCCYIYPGKVCWAGMLFYQSPGTIVHIWTLLCINVAFPT